MLKLRSGPLALAALVGLGLQPLHAAHAQTPEATPSPSPARAVSPWSFSGFATLGVARTNRSDAEFGVPGQPSGASRSAAATVDSKLGLQASLRVSPLFSATAQVLTKYNGDGNWDPKFEWLFAKAQVTPQLAVRVGRVGLPVYGLSDYREVNYANVWVRPPLDVYGQMPVSHLDGADASWQLPLGDATLTTQLYAGQSSSSYTRNPVKLTDMVGFNSTAEWSSGLSLRVGYVSGKITVSNASITRLVNTLAATPYAAVGQQIDASARRAQFMGIGAGYDAGNWVTSAEYTQRHNSSYVSDTSGWYASVGYRVGAFTPYGVVSAIKVDDSNVDNTIPKGVNAQLTALSSAVDSVIALQALGQKTLAVGVRWDAVRNVALKAQLEHIRTDGGRGLSINPQAGFGDGASVNACALTVDVVF